MAGEQAQGGAGALEPRAGLGGRIASALPVIMMAVSAAMKIVRANPAGAPGRGPRFGYPDGTLIAIGVTELACAVLYVIPRTSVLGAILVTGYLGRRHRVARPHQRSRLHRARGPRTPGRGGLFLRDPRLRALLPLRQESAIAAGASASGSGARARSNPSSRAMSMDGYKRLLGQNEPGSRSDSPSRLTTSRGSRTTRIPSTSGLAARTAGSRPRRSPVASRASCSSTATWPTRWSTPT